MSDCPTETCCCCRCIFSPQSLEIKALCLSPTQTDAISFTLSFICPCSPGVSHVFDHKACCVVRWLWKSAGACVLKAGRGINCAALWGVCWVSDSFFQTKHMRAAERHDCLSNLFVIKKRYESQNWACCVSWCIIDFYLSFCRAQWNINRLFFFCLSEDVTHCLHFLVLLTHAHMQFTNAHTHR